ncbi:hypothetical protein ADIARSV_4199 [Arcticibacter svalbardensis MN12-7]|uniref:DUF4153 domain-containing protein n=1 Tax=Arcticibacter svalbardensis MN12-7 TaxID=1150600 RepID=R9GLJ6_9SPHI|nr:DUF4153 domain-containing protein [Arcticibacter svalbardensis]EOR92687.1 hypothetical protein ADIARSV_4199 [Arcticibacter svalbardensis MN12-7]
MKFPSLYSLGQSIQRVVLRFPLQVLASVAATLVWCYMIDPIGDVKIVEDNYIKFILVCNLALVLLLAGDLYAEVNNFSMVKKWIIRTLGVLICTGLYFALHPSYYDADIYRIGLIAFAFHLLVAFVPFIKHGNLNDFWGFNKTLFLRFLTSVLYAWVLYGGLAVALLAIDGLFSVDINSKIYMMLFAGVTAGFMTIFFLSGVPEVVESDKAVDSYPKGLKIFTQYVLIPLMTIYLGILLVYEIKIIIIWELPKGMVSALILGYAVFGILSLLLIYPIREKSGNGWIKMFSKVFYFMMIPLVVLLLLAVWKRVGHYGITESRFILVLLAVWLTFNTIYFLFSKRQNIKIIPISLCILALLSTYGPQSAFSVSRYSQVLRLKRLMASREKEDIRQRAGVVRYLVDRHGLHSLQNFTKVDLSALESRMENKAGVRYRYEIKNKLLDTAYALLKVKEDDSNFQRDVTFIAPGNEMIDVKGYDYMVDINSYANKTETTLNGLPVVVERLEPNKNLHIKIGKGIVAELDVNKLIKNAAAKFKKGRLKSKSGNQDRYYLSKDSFVLMQQVDAYDVSLVISSLTVPNTDDQKRINRETHYTGYLLIRLRSDQQKK